MVIINRSSLLFNFVLLARVGSTPHISESSSTVIRGKLNDPIFSRCFILFTFLCESVCIYIQLVIIDAYYRRSIFDSKGLATSQELAVISLAPAIAARSRKLPLHPNP